MVGQCGGLGLAHAAQTRMINRSKTMKLVRRIFLGILTGILGAAPLMAAEGKSRITNSASGAEEDLFAQPKVHRLKLELPDSSVEALRKEPRHYVKATLRE